MSTLFSNWLSKKDKTPMKPAGCVTRIFQLFDRHHLLRRRQLIGQEHKKNSSGQKEADYSQLCYSDKNLNSSNIESSRSCMESSSSSKSFSSLDYRSQQDKLTSSEQSFLSGIPPTNASDIKQSPGLRDIIIKESEPQKNKVLKPIDSPRPIVDLSKLKDLEESLRILIKLKELPIDFHEARGSTRYSCDGKEILQQQKDINHVIRQKEHRRLSLDSIEDSRMCDFNSKFNLLIRELKISEASNLLQNRSSNENHPNIVAKLMGLDPIINPSKKNCSKDYDDKESKQGKLLQYPINSPKSQRSIDKYNKSNSSPRFMIEETQQKMRISSMEGNMKHKTDSVHNVKEKILQKLQFQQNSKEISRKSSGDCNFRSVNGPEKGLKSPTLAIKPESKSANTSLSRFSELEGHSGLRKIRTSDSSNRKEESSIISGEQTPTEKKANSLLKSLSKETSRRGGNNSAIPSLQKRKPDQEKKSGILIPSNEVKKSQKQHDKQLESESPRCRIRQKPSKAQDNEGNSHLFHQPKGKTDTKTDSRLKHKQHQMIQREVLYEKELEKVVMPLSSPNSVLYSPLYPDDSSLSPMSVSSISNEDVNLPTDHNMKMMHLHPTLHSNLDFGADSQKSEIMDTIELLGTIKPPVTNEVTSILQNHRPVKKYVEEFILESDILSEDKLNLFEAWDRFESEEPVVVIEIERLIFADLIYEIVSSMSAVVLQTKGRHRR